MESKTLKGQKNPFELREHSSNKTLLLQLKIFYILRRSRLGLTSFQCPKAQLTLIEHSNIIPNPNQNPKP